MDAALAYHRFHFAFTVAYHYLFPQLTMGLALLIVVLKTRALRTGEERLHRAARFWGKIFGLAFAMGVVTGIPMEFQFGTNWARFSEASGGVIGQTLAMEGVFAFFLESSFLGIFLFGEKRLGPKLHWLSAVAVWIGAWVSGFFIVATNAFMQHPVAYEMTGDGTLALTSFTGLLTNPWLVWQYLHTMLGAVVTGAVVMTAVGAYYLLMAGGGAEAGAGETDPAATGAGAAGEEGPPSDAGRDAAGHGGAAGAGRLAHGRLFVGTGLAVGLPAAVLLAFPTGDFHAQMVAEHKPAAFASMEGLFTTMEGAPLAIIGQPDVEARRLDNPIEIPRALSFLTYRRWAAEVKGLEAFPRSEWPDNVPLHYYAYHIMVGLGTIFIAVLALGAWRLRRGTLFRSRATLWALMLLAPFPFIANTAGWMTAELGRQPWLIYGVLRTEDGFSASVSSGNALFTLIGFMGLYLVLGILFLFLAGREVAHGPEAVPSHADGGGR